jgi:uncharacterized protein YyaL (SSP411 family)
MLGALDFHLAPPVEVAIIGPEGDPGTQALLQVVRQQSLPNTVVVYANPEEAENLGGRIPLLASRQTIHGRPTAYVCVDMACRLPVHTAEELAEQLATH